MLKKSLASTVLIASMLPSIAFAAGVYSKVTTILIDDVNFGGCMAALETPPSTSGLICKDPWVTFSCTGEFNSKSQAAIKVAAAQLALVTQTKLYVEIDDTKKHNGYCFARRVDNYRTPPVVAP
jgi:hypothetical protein